MIPGLTTYYIDQARLHAAEYGKGVSVPKSHEFFRRKLDQHKLAHALEFFFNPMFNEVCSYGTKEMKLACGEIVTIPEVVRTVCHTTFIKTYRSFCKESSFESLSNSSLYRILQSCPASKRTNLKGIDNIAADGAAAFESLSKLVSDLQQHVVITDTLKEILKKIHASKVYVKTDFKLHVQTQDPCPDHCLRFALSDVSNSHLKVNCQHNHNLSCDRCNLLPDAVNELKQLISDEKDITGVKKLELLSDIDNAHQNIHQWKEHIIRSINQDFGRTELLEKLTSNETLIVMDWAMKFLPMLYREKQSDWFGQKESIGTSVYAFTEMKTVI